MTRPGYIEFLVKCDRCGASVAPRVACPICKNMNISARGMSRYGSSLLPAGSATVTARERTPPRPSRDRLRLQEGAR